MTATRLSKPRFDRGKLLLIVLFGVGIFIRLIPVITGNTFFWFDQGLDTLMVQILVVNHKINLISRYSGLSGVLMGPLWTWLLAIPFALTHGDVRAFSLFMSLLSLVSAGITFVFVKKLFNFLTAIIATAWILLAPIFVFNSTVAASPHPLTSLFILFIWFSYELFVNKKSKFWIPLLLLCGIFFQFEIGFGLFTLPVVLVLMIIFKKLPDRYFFLGVLAGALTFAPQILFDFRHSFIITKGFLGIFGRNSLYSAHNSLLGRFGDRAWSFGDDFLTMVLLFRNPLIVIPAVLAMIYGWYLSNQKKLLVILVTIIAVFYVGFSFYPGPLWVWYRAGLPIVYVLLFAVPISIIWQKFKLFRIFLLLFFLSWIVYAIKPADIKAQLSGKIVNDVSSRKTQEMVLDYIYKDAAGKPFAYYAYTPPVYDYIWQYDFWQYGKGKYGYLPKNWQLDVPLLNIGTQPTPPTTDEGLFYLIMEPNPDRPWEPQGWATSFIKVGNILETKYFPGNVIVEKRMTEKL